MLSDALATLRLLIVDDEPAICSTLQHTLRYYGYGTEATSDGATALALLLREQFDLLLLDPRLPGRIDGQNLIHLATTQQPDAVIILLTGTLDLAIPYNRIDLRRFAALDKSASPAAIAASVERTLAQRINHANQLHLAR